MRVRSPVVVRNKHYKKYTFASKSLKPWYSSSLQFVSEPVGLDWQYGNK